VVNGLTVKSSPDPELEIREDATFSFGAILISIGLEPSAAGNETTGGVNTRNDSRLDFDSAESESTQLFMVGI